MGLLSTRLSSIFTALLLTASPAGSGVAARKLASLGATLDGDAARGTDAHVATSATLTATATATATAGGGYGVDRSFPVHHRGEDSADENPLGSEARRFFYREFMAGCYLEYPSRECDASEAERTEMNLRQPAGMQNYTALGFHKVRAPPGLRGLLAKFWRRHSPALAAAPDETWDAGNTHTNHWASPTKMLPLDSAHRKAVWDAARAALEAWIAAEGGGAAPELSPSSLYGVRVHRAGAVLAPHVDRTPLVLSALVNVAQDVDAPWPIELYGHDGRAHNVTLAPGDMVLYEGHSVVHGMPFPLAGRHSAHVVAHFEPRGHALRREEEAEEDDLAALYRRAWDKARSRCGDEDKCRGREGFDGVATVPRYLPPGSEEEGRWLQAHPKARLATDPDGDRAAVKSLSAHTAASTGDLEALRAIAAADPDALQHRDGNGWNPLHEAVRGGHLNAVKYLLSDEVGLDVNERTHRGSGGTPLWWAKKSHGKTHPVVQHLESVGARDIAPDGHKMKGDKWKENKKEDEKGDKKGDGAALL